VTAIKENYSANSGSASMADLAVADLTEATRQCIETAQPVRPRHRSEADRSSVMLVRG
jgi:hypothetical protein